MTLNNTRKNQKQQLENRQAQLFWNVYDKLTNDTMKNALNILRTIEFKDYEEFKAFWDNNQPNNVERDAMMTLAGYLEGLGVLIREGYVSIRLVALLMTGTTLNYYRKQAPYVEQYRVHTGFEGFLSETEYLYNQLTQYIKENPNYRKS
jgi:hypothetical protein